MNLQMTKTPRGCRRAEFVDFFGNRNSIQESAISTDSCIWLGCEQTMTGEESSRMHLTRTMVAALLPALAHFVLRGSLPDRVDRQAEPIPMEAKYADAYEVLLDEFGRWLGEDGDDAPDAFEAEMRNAIRLGAMGALSNAIARLTAVREPTKSGVVARIGPAGVWPNDGTQRVS